MFSRAELLDTAQASPRAVAAHDKSTWLGLFADDAEVHDPVGSRGHAGPAALARFYDTFIAPNQIRFDVDHDIVCGQTVVRDLVIVTHMGGTALTVGVPLYIRYEIVAGSDGRPRVRRLYAHWELLPMMTRQVFSQGLRTGLSALLALSGNMLRQQGLSGALGFSRAFVGVGASAKRCAEQFLNALNAGQTAHMRQLVEANAPIQLANQTVALDALCTQLSDIRWSKVIAGGRQVVLTLFQQEQRMVAVFDFAHSSSQISALTIYRDTA
ncbi:MAG: nuclear transport factor 2 family protein [Oceanococcus sp.]|nr:MAG: nuclear transport factor 2 family protein [Oceanococcus sp.]